MPDINEGKFNERDRLVKAFAYEFVCFNHDVHNSHPYLVTDVTDDCMLELEGMSGVFAPDLFKLVECPEVRASEAFAERAWGGNS